MIVIQLAKKEFAEALTTDPIAGRKLVTGLEDNDPNWLSFIRKSVPEVDSIGVQQACHRWINAGRIETRFQEKLAARNLAVSDFLIQKQGIPAELVQVSVADLNNPPQELRIPQFKIEVSLKDKGEG